MAENRLKRDLETREMDERPKQWKPPSLLPDPIPQPGYSYHWVRVSTRGETDAPNVSARLREGWEPVKAADHPEIFMVGGVEHKRFKDNIIIGGLLLCKTPIEFVEQRNDYYHSVAKNQLAAVDTNLMRENDARMPLFAERKSKTTFGSGTQ